MCQLRQARDRMHLPTARRAPRRKKRALKAELVSKVKALEEKVRELEDGKNSSHSDADPSHEEAPVNTKLEPRYLVLISQVF